MSTTTNGIAEAMKHDNGTGEAVSVVTPSVNGNGDMPVLSSSSTTDASSSSSKVENGGHMEGRGKNEARVKPE